MAESTFVTIVEHSTVLGNPIGQSQLSYLERQADSGTVTVYVHGLGLDARDYADCLKDRHEHGVALTLLGFEPDARHLLHGVPIETHVQLVSEFVKKIADKHGDKRLNIVGFSLGADMILRLTQYWQQNPDAAPPVDSLLLLDPNINQTTMSISQKVNQANLEDLESTFQKIRDLAPEDPALDNYVETIKTKNFTQLRQLSRDTLDYWQPTGHEQIGQRLATTNTVTPNVHVVFSNNYRNDLPAIIELARSWGAGDIRFDMIEGGHFDLMSSEVLFPRLDLL